MTCAGIISYMNFGTFSLDILGQVRKHKWKMYREGAILAQAKIQKWQRNPVNYTHPKFTLIMWIFILREAHSKPHPLQFCGHGIFGVNCIVTGSTAGTSQGGEVGISAQGHYVIYYLRTCWSKRKKKINSCAPSGIISIAGRLLRLILPANVQII